MTIYQLEEVAFSCKDTKARERTQIIVFSGGNVDRKSWSKWKERAFPNSSLPEMARFCPAEKGYVRIGNEQLKVEGVMRSRSAVNTIIKDPEGRTMTLSIDCERLMISTGGAMTPIRPGSRSQKMYNVLCK